MIAPGDAGYLWTAVQSSHCVEIALGMDDNIDRKYLEALAETYQHATSWDTRRQVLAIIADLVPYRDIQKFIPGLTDYRIKEARMHILKYGHGAAVPLTKSPRMRVNESQLDHFLTFNEFPCSAGPSIWPAIPPFGKRSGFRNPECNSSNDPTKNH